MTGRRPTLDCNGAGGLVDGRGAKVQQDHVVRVKLRMASSCDTLLIFISGTASREA